MPTRVTLTGFTVWMAILTALYFARPSWQVATWAAIGASGALAIVIGVRRHRPRRPVPWLFVAGSLLAYVVADTVAAELNRRYGAPAPLPLVIDLCYLAMFLLLVWGLHGLTRSGAAAADRASLLDAVTLTAGLGLVFWIYLTSPRIAAADLTVLDTLSAVGYPLADLLIIAMVARLVLASPWTPSVALLATGAVSLFVGDVSYLLGKLAGHWQLGGPLDLTWILFYTTWGLAALHPSMTRLTEPGLVRPTELTTRRLVLLALSSLIAPTVLLIEALDGPVRDGVVIALACGLMFLLVLARLLAAMRAHRRALARERGLREAGAALVAATETTQVATAARTTVAHLLREGTPHRVVLAFGGPWAGAASVCDTAQLPARLAARLRGFDVALCVPLRLAQPSAGGALLIAAAEEVLVPLTGAVEVLASQAALALERITLSEEINRRDSEAYFRTLVQNAADVILIVDDDDDRVRYASPSAADLFGRSGPLAGTHLLDLVTPEARPAARATLRAVRSGDGPPRDADWTVSGRERGPRQVAVSSRDLRADPTVQGLVITLRDVTDRRQLERALHHQAFHDSLTGLANRVLFNDHVTRAVAGSPKDGTVAGVLVIDLDDFKVVNDTLGHPAGDELLVAVAGRLTGVLRPRDTAGRLGGDEFAALIEEARDPTAVEAVAERIIAVLAEPFSLGDDLVSGAASIGIATTGDAGDADELLRQADLALYVAKGAGKGQWRRYQPALHTAIVDRLHLRAELDKAVKSRAFELRFQPVVELGDGHTIGFEALVRWHHPTRGTLPPGEFIEVAEQTGLIVPIGYQLLEQAVAAGAQWYRDAPPGRAPYVSVNVSARQFRARGFVEKVREELARAGLPPDRLMLEITESLLMPEEEQVWLDLAQLRQLGVRVAIDDFGTGYSSLSYLQQVPLDVVKIDRLFIGTIGSSAKQRALVKGIVQIADTLGLQVIAEGIETVIERDVLIVSGCPYGQGYLFSKPLTRAAATRWLLDAPELSGRKA